MPGVAETRTYDALLTTTLANYRPLLVDNIFDVYPLLSWMNGKLGEAQRGAKIKRTLDGGESIVEQVLYEMSTSGGPYSAYGTIAITPQEGMTRARYDWRQYAWTVTISGLERRNNSGQAKIVDLLKGKIQQAEQSMRDTMSRHAWGAGGGSPAQIDGINAIVLATGTVGGLNQSTFSWWAATSRTGGSFAAQGINDMRIVFNTISFGNDKPDAIFMPQAVFEYFENTLQPQQRYTDQRTANTGFENITFHGVPAIFDRDSVSGQITFLNSKYINWCVHKDADMDTGAFITPENQDASTAKIIWQGNMTTNNRRMHGRVISVTA